MYIAITNNGLKISIELNQHLTDTVWKINVTFTKAVFVAGLLCYTTLDTFLLEYMDNLMAWK